MFKSAKILAVFFVVLALGVNCLWAELITINLTAEITEIGDGDNLLNGQLHVGDNLTGSYTYDSTTPDDNYATTVGDYWHYNPPCGISLSGGGFTFQTDPDDVRFLIEVCDNRYLNEDSYLVNSYNNLPLYGDVLVNSIVWDFHDDSGTALSSDALPTTAPVLQNWLSTNELAIEGPRIQESGGLSFYIVSTVTSAELIPEPATILLFSLGALALKRKHQ